MTHTAAQRRQFNVFATILSFVIAIVILTGAAITTAGFFQARHNVARAAASTMDAVVQRISEQVSTFFGPAEFLVDIYAQNPEVTQNHERIEVLLPSIFSALERRPQITGVYAGYETGEFWEVFSFLEYDRGVLELIDAPDGSRFAVQTIRNAGDGARVETWRFLDSERREIGRRTSAAPGYDPRARDWYRIARAQPGVTIRTPPYLFASVSRAGLTVARAFDGPTDGVLGIDVTLDSLSSFLARVRPSPGHHALLLDAEGRMLASSDPGQTLTVAALRLSDLTDPVLRAVAARFAAQGAFDVERFNVGGEVYLASVTRLPPSTLGGDGDFILNVAPRSSFEGTLVGAAQRYIFASILVLIVISPAIVYFARTLARPIKALADNAKLIEAIIDTIPNPVFYKGPDSRFIGCNDAYEAVFSMSRCDIIGKRVDDLEYLPDAAKKEFQEEDEAIIRDGTAARREVVMRFADGRAHTTLYHTNGFRRADGSPGGMVGTIVDISQIKETEKALEAAKELAEAATRAKSEFLASMSHEIRTPLNGIMGMADLLSQSDLGDDQKHMLHTIRESGNALMRVINDILDFSKIEAGKLEIEKVTMSVADALEGVASTLTPAARAKGIRVHAFVDPRIPATVLGDPVRLRQILFNLAGNAVKFSNKNDVSVRALSCAPGRVRFEVIDNGIGISRENQAKLFQAFNQAESSTTRRYGGTGLGLAICKRLAELMHGEIGVESELDRGSTFFVELDLPEAPGTASRAAQQTLAGLKVLLVGSPPPRADTVRAYLLHWGARCETAPDEADALEMGADAAKGEAYNSAVIDLDFDQERQQGLIAQWRGVSALAGVPMIVLEDMGSRSARIRSADIVAVDANPLMRHRIVSAVAVAAGRASPEIRHIEEEADAPVEAPTVAEARAQGTLILLAEDNPTNQDVIRRQLQRLGYVCEIAGNGAEALAAWRRGHYGLILTDCHMPEMDGYEFTGNVRAEERDSGRRIPIVAVTANALQGEVERCLRAGMDDYLTKPMTMRALRDMLRKWMPAASPAAQDPAQAAPAPAAESGAVEEGAAEITVDPRVIKDMFGDDDVTFREILDSFVDPSRRLIADAAAAVAARDTAAVKGIAHQLKSSSRAIGANPLADICVALEAAAKAEDWSEIDRLHPLAAAWMARVMAWIEALAPPQGPPAA